ncbi:MAG: twin-arginine translocase TatA/TatE family subunit [Acidimicrobiales bacterium]
MTKTGDGKQEVRAMVAEIFGMDGIVVLVVVMAVLFGGTQIPKLARSLGSARREFTEGLHDGADGAHPSEPVTGPPA